MASCKCIRPTLWLLIAGVATSSVAAAADHGGAHRQSGPMIGHVGPREARIWIKASAAATVSAQVSDNAGLQDARTIEGPQLAADEDFVGQVHLTGLKPSTRYYYQVYLDDHPAMLPDAGSFTTAPEVGSPTQLRFAFVSCAGHHGYEPAAAWGDMEGRSEIDMLLMLGDNHYADTTRSSEQRAAYYEHRSVPAFRALTQRVPAYAIWDDHDYGVNNGDGTAQGKQASLATFKQFWPNPGCGETDNPGIYFKFSRGNIDFFMLDGRYHRSPNRAPADGMKTLLGSKQFAWLKRGLENSTAAVKFVACGSEWQKNGHIDSWSSFKREQREFFDFVGQNDIQGVILLSGDRHFTGGYQIDGRLIEVTSGPLGSINYPTQNLPEMFLNLGTGKMFCVFDVDTTVNPPAVVLEVYRAGDGLVDRRDFTWDEINGKNRLALLPVPRPAESESTLPLVCQDGFESGDDNWQPTDRHAWRVIEQDGTHVYSLHRQSRYSPPHRSPSNISLLQDKLVGDFELRARVLTTTPSYGHRSMCLFFGYQDPAHFYYVHLGQKSDEHANQIFIVNDAPRVKISTKTTPGTSWDEQWHDVKIVRRIASGLIEIYWDDMDHPVMTATDKTFAWGQVGLGSFDDTGNWDDIRLHGIRVSASE